MDISTTNASLAAVARLTDALAHASTLEAVYAAALDALQQSLGVDRASILLFDADEVMSFVAWRGLSDRYRAAVNGHTPWRPDSTDVDPICVADAFADPALADYKPVFEAEGIRALGFFPLMHRGRVIGKFMLYHAEPHACGADELALAQTIAGQIAFGVARVRAELALQDERDRLDDLITSVPGAVWETVGRPGEDQHLTFISPRIEEILGYPVETWYRTPNFWNEVIVNHSPDEIVEMSLQSMVAVPTNVHHYRMRTRDGRLIWCEVRTASKREGDRLILRGVTTDITAQKEAQLRSAFLSEASSVLASSLEYETTLGHVARLVVEQFADWCTIDVRDEDGDVHRLYVTHRDPSRGAAVERMKTLLPQERTARIRNVVESGEPLLVRHIDWDDLRGRYGDDAEVMSTIEALGAVSYMIVPLVAGGRSFGAISIISASAERIFGEADLDLASELGRRAGYAIDNARLFRQAQDANRAKDEFLATLSHELRTPLTSTLGWATMLRTQELPPEMVRVAIDTIERSTRAQAKLIDEILDVSRIVTGKLQLTVAPLNVRTILEAALEAIRPSITAKGLELHVAVDETAGAPLGDAARLQQVIWNLLSNSVKFTAPGGAIHVGLDQPAPAQLRISVRDTGCGISRKFLPHIFERFRQADSSASRAHGGLGLGLAIVKSIVELHGGTVSATSDGEGLGATFTIVLPVVSGPAVAAPPAAEANAPLALSGISVLLVEDEDDTRYMLSAALQSFGARVTAVRSAAAALDAMQSAPPTVLVSDIGMPDEDGYSLIMKIRSGAVERARHVPAIALTAYARPEDREQVLAAGFAWHLAKPVDPMVVVRTVREAARR